MGKEYTKKLLSEAWNGALTFFLKGECPVTISRAALGAIILLFITYIFFKPQLIEVLVGLILIPIAVFLLAFFFFFIRAPYKVHREQESKITALKENDTERRKKWEALCAMNVCLSKGMSMLFRPTCDNQQLQKELPDFTKECQDAIRRISNEEAENFERMGSADAPWSALRAKVENLRNIICRHAKSIYEEKTHP